MAIIWNSIDMDVQLASDNRSQDQFGPAGRSRVAAWIARLVRRMLGFHDESLSPTDQFSDADWRLAEEILRTNRLWSLAAEDLPEQAPAALRALIAREMARIRMFNLRTLTTTRQVSTILAARGIDALVIKGPLQQVRVLGSTFVRAASDVDLWVRQSDRVRAGEVLESAGFASHPDCSSLWWRHFLGEAHHLPPTQGHCEVDLHHRLHQPGSPVLARPEAFFRAAQGSARFAGSVPLPSPAHAFLIACLALTKGLLARQPSGHYALEVAATCRWGGHALRDEIWAAAREQRMERPAAFAISLCEEAFGIDLAMGQKASPKTGSEVARTLLLSQGHPEWPRRKLIWTVCDGEGHGRARRFARTYGGNIAGQLCQRFVYAPAIRRRQRRNRRLAPGEAGEGGPNPNPA